MQVSMATIAVLLVALPLPGVTAGCTSPQCRDDYDPATRVFHRIYWGLDAVPRDVPDATLELYLYGNNIAVIPAGAFSRLSRCTILFLSSNNISRVERGAWDGLRALSQLRLLNNKLTHLYSNMFHGLSNLTDLSLTENRISSIDPQAFIGLYSLQKLWLYGNNLTRLDPGYFAELPRPFSLSLSNPRAMEERPWDCSQLCWLKQEELERTVQWLITVSGHSPKCGAGLDWDTLNCTSAGSCPEPGGVPHARRSGAEYPYHTGDVVHYACVPPYYGNGSVTCLATKRWSERPVCAGPSVCPEPPRVPHASRAGAEALPYALHAQILYTCDACFTGGGSITCLSTGAWSGRPNCSADVCVGPAEVEHAVRDPPRRRFRCNETVTYVCDVGYGARGEATLRCGEDGFRPGPPSCVRGNSSQASSEDEKEDSADPHIYHYDEVKRILTAVIIVVAVLLLMLLVLTAALFFCWRRQGTLRRVTQAECPVVETRRPVGEVAGGIELVPEAPARRENGHVIRQASASRDSGIDADVIVHAPDQHSTPSSTYGAVSINTYQSVPGYDVADRSSEIFI